MKSGGRASLFSQGELIDQEGLPRSPHSSLSGSGHYLNARLRVRNQVRRGAGPFSGASEQPVLTSTRCVLGNVGVGLLGLRHSPGRVGSDLETFPGLLAVKRQTEPG